MDCPFKTSSQRITLHFISLSSLFSFTDWILGPKPVEDDSEEVKAELEAPHRLSICGELSGKDVLKMEKERDGPLPGFYQGDGGCCHPSTPPAPLRSAIASSSPGEKQTSTHSVTFKCLATPYATSLWASLTEVVHILTCPVPFQCSNHCCLFAVVMLKLFLLSIKHIYI